MTDLDLGADLRERFDRALTDLHAPDALTAAVLTDGHRLRRRRRVLTAASGVAAVAFIAALAIPSLGGSTAGTDSEIATQPSATPSADPSTRTPGPSTPTPGPANDDPFPELPPGWWDMPSTDMVAVLEDLLPADVTVAEADTKVETGDPDRPLAPAKGGLNGVLEGPSGTGAFQIILYGPELPVASDPVTTTDADGNKVTMNYATGPTHESRIRCRQAHDTCEPITNEDGVHIGRVATAVERGTTYFDVALLGPDGGALYFYVADSSGEKPGYEPPTADTPPLTLDQLRSLAEVPAWTSYTP